MTKCDVRATAVAMLHQTRIPSQTAPSVQGDRVCGPTDAVALRLTAAL